MIKITFPDGSVKSYNKGVTGLEIAESISPRLAKEVLAAQVKAVDDTSANKGVTYDITQPIEKDSLVRLLKWDDEEGKKVFWHSSSHLLAEALESMYPGVKFGIGPAVENGFYYDVDLGEHQITEADLPKIAKEMLRIARQKGVFERKDVSKAEAIEYFTKKGDEYKLELIEELPDGTISFYTNVVLYIDL